MELANNYGGWEKVQELLQVIKTVADKHNVKMQTVALRWQIDQVRGRSQPARVGARGVGVRVAPAATWPWRACQHQKPNKQQTNNDVRLQGVFPVATVRWSEQTWNQFGYTYWNEARPGVDPQLFQVESFLDEHDLKMLNVAGL